MPALVGVQRAAHAGVKEQSTPLDIDGVQQLRQAVRQLSSAGCGRK